MVMDIIRSIFLILFLVFLCSTQKYFILSLGMICKENERTALLTFKQHLRDPSDSLSSWSGENCCSWDGVVCSNRTDHVIGLQLQELGLGGELNPSLQELKQLTHLDLSSNDFQRISIPGFVGSLQSLRYLNLSNASFGGRIPHQLGNLSNLRYLDLSYSWELTVVGNFQWISHLSSSLKYLDLSGVNLENASNWFRAVNMLQSLLVLRLTSCSLSGTISPSIGNLTKLTLLDLSLNQLEGEIPSALGNLCKLRRLDLSNNKLTGEISGFLGSLQNLEHLSLWSNSFSGCIPFSIGRLTLLTHLDLSRNELNGSIPKSFGNLSKLQTLCLTYNALEGNVSQGLLSALTSLHEIKLDSVVLKVTPEWIPPFQLRRSVFRNGGLGPRFPNWIQTQKLLRYLDLSGNGISGSVPSWFWNLSSQFIYLNLSHNHFNGELPKVLKAASFILTNIDLSSNRFKGPLPRLASGVSELDLSNNSFPGPISAFLCNPLTEANDLRVLDLSNNHLSGDLSQCWFYWTSLSVVRLGSNNITGRIPSSMGSLLRLTSLHLENNNLYGELPSSLTNCTSLVTVDIGENVLTGRLPLWLGERFSYLLVLRLRRNKLHGEIPQQLCDLTSLQMLDLAHNNLSGSIPRCFRNFSAMATEQNSLSRLIFYYSLSPDVRTSYVETASLVTKGREFEYSNTLALVTSMDLSKNSLSGEIPEELTGLLGLRFLNLSDNRFTGKIPEKIGNMGLLESLDFSNNNISGVIPQSISVISSLSHLNLSYNNFSGKIPLGTQLQSFTKFSFIGNQDLCGPPLKNCNGEEPPQKPTGNSSDEDEDWFEMKWFYMSMGVGFAVGFLPFWVVLVFKKS